jgi:hypothetical protein
MKSLKLLTDNVDIKKLRMGILSLDFERIVIFGGERSNNEFKESYTYNFGDRKFGSFSSLAECSKFNMLPVYNGGRFILFDGNNNIHEFNTDTMTFDYQFLQNEEDVYQYTLSG